jgi:hypothetical protein
MGFSDAVFNPHTFQLQPMTIIPIAPIGTGGQVPLIPLPNTSDPNFAQLTITDLRMQIKALLFAEQPMDSKSVQPQTTYELSLKQQSLAEKIGPLFSRMQQEFLWPCIKRFAYILHSMGKLPYPEIGGMPIVFKYKSPLAKAKGRADVESFTQWVQLMQGIMGPESVMMYINPKTTPYMLAEMLQVDERFLNKPDAVARVGQQLMDQHNEAKLAQASGMMPEAPPNPVQSPIAPPI